MRALRGDGLLVVEVAYHAQQLLQALLVHTVEVDLVPAAGGAGDLGFDHGAEDVRVHFGFPNGGSNGRCREKLSGAMLLF